MKFAKSCDMDLLGAGVSIEQCQYVVQSVLKNLFNVEVDRLPKKSLASMISIEAHILSQTQAAEAMLRNQNNCLHLDGTKKEFTEYSGFQVSTDEGSFSLSHQIMAAGDACSYLKATNETFEELAESVTDDDNQKKEMASKLKSTISNIMTDRHIVNKKYKKLLEEDIGSEINGLFCGLHILPNMATAALTGMEHYEKGQNIAPSSNWTSKSVGNSLIYECAKAFIESSGCQKSGDALDFNDYLSTLNVKNQIITFLHNRFNVLFIDGGAVFYHRKHINDYLNSGRSSKNNKLLSSIDSHISNAAVLAECRALGIIGKLVCGPLWRLLEDDNISYFAMNDYWYILVEKVGEYSKNAAPLLSGEKVFANIECVEDKVYKCLFEQYPELDNLTVEALQSILTSIEPMLQRQLKDQLPGGSMHVPTDGQVIKCKNVPKTNRISEADFSALDRLVKKAPQKGRAAKSATITYTVNKTSKFLRKLSNEKRDKYFRIARKVSKRRVEQDKLKKYEVRHERLKAQKNRIDQKLKKQQRAREYKGKLETQMKAEGIWLNEDHAVKELEGKTNTKKRCMIMNQINYHAKLLGSKIPSKSLIKFQENKTKLGHDQLLENLKIIMAENFTAEIPQVVQNINSNLNNLNQTNRKRRLKGPNKVTRKQTKRQKVDFQVNNFYAVAFTDRWYPGRCEQIIDEDTAVLEFLVPSGKHFKWPNKKDIQTVKTLGCLSKITVDPISNGRLWAVQEHNEIDSLFIK